MNSKTPHPLLGKVSHAISYSTECFINDGNTRKNTRMLGYHVEHVAIVRPVVTHLNEDNPRHALWSCVSEQLIGCETRRFHILTFKAWSERILIKIWSPNMHMGVDVCSASSCPGSTPRQRGQGGGCGGLQK